MTVATTSTAGRAKSQYLREKSCGLPAAGMAAGAFFSDPYLHSSRERFDEGIHSKFGQDNISFSRGDQRTYRVSLLLPRQLQLNFEFFEGVDFEPSPRPLNTVLPSFWDDAFRAALGAKPGEALPTVEAKKPPP